MALRSPNDDISRVLADDTSRVLADDTSRVLADDTSRVLADDTSRVLADDTSRVLADDTSRVLADDTSRVLADDTSRVLADDTSRVLADDTSRVLADDTSRVLADDTSRVLADDTSRVLADDTSRVLADDTSRVLADDTSRVLADDTSRVLADDTSRVLADDTSRVLADDTSRVLADDTSRVLADDTSRVLADDASRVLADDKLHDECGVFGVWKVPDAAAVTALGLHALQHRGQESTGIVSFDGSHFHSHRGLGLVGDNFSDARVIASLPGPMAIGHNRYATTGATILRNVQPLYADFEFGGFAVAHNGNLTNAHVLRRTLVRRGCLFQSTSDSEVFVHLIAISLYSTVVDRLIDALKQVVGAYSLVALSTEALMGVRDPLGVRPLILGRIGGDKSLGGTGGWVLASETCALDIVGADFVRDVEPGEVVVINDQGVHSIKPFGRSRERFCVFEYIYFARPDSVMEGTPVYDARKSIGAELARETAVPADVVVPVPDSGVPAAMGYASESGIPFELGIIRNHYVGRTFIEPTDHIRHLGVKLKHSANRSVLAGKRVILVDDSIVRGTTSRKIVEMVRAAGAREVHMRISSPPITHSCFYGIDTPERGELLASRLSVEEMAEQLCVDSLAFLSIDGLYRALGKRDRDPARPHYCDACLTGEYPIALPDQADNSERQLSLLAESH